MSRLSFPERLERVLMVGMVAGILVLALSPRVLWMYQAGLGILIVSTFLQIAVGNIPAHYGVARSLRHIVIILAIVAAVFVLGILLVPVLSRLGV